MNKRLAWIDMAKGVAIILVMLPHYGMNGIVQNEIYTFHMPLFFLLSGYCFSITKYRNFKPFLLSRIKSLVVPYFSFSFIIFALYIANRYLHFYAPLNISLRDAFIGIFVNMRSTKYYISMWFLTCLFVAEILLYFICRLSKSNMKLFAILLIISSIIGYAYCIYVKKVLPWNIDLSFTAVAFLGIGYLAKVYKDRIKGFFKIKFVPIYVGLNMAFGYLNYITNGHRRVDVEFGRFGNYLLFYASAVCGIAAVIIALKSLPNIAILTYIGRNSIIYYSLHHENFLYDNITVFLLHHANYFNVLSRFSSVRSIVLTIIMCCVLFAVSYIINHYFPFLIGKKREHSYKQKDIYSN